MADWCHARRQHAYEGRTPTSDKHSNAGRGTTIERLHAASGLERAWVAKASPRSIQLQIDEAARRLTSPKPELDEAIKRRLEAFVRNACEGATVSVKTTPYVSANTHACAEMSRLDGGQQAARSRPVVTARTHQPRWLSHDRAHIRRPALLPRPPHGTRPHHAPKGQGTQRAVYRLRARHVRLGHPSRGTNCSRQLDRPPHRLLRCIRRARHMRRGTEPACHGQRTNRRSVQLHGRIVPVHGRQRTPRQRSLVRAPPQRHPRGGARLRLEETQLRAQQVPSDSNGPVRPTSRRSRRLHSHSHCTRAG